MKKTVRLTESELKHLISESVKRVLREGVDDFNNGIENIKILCHLDFNAGYSNGWNYSCDVYRSFKVVNPEVEYDTTNTFYTLNDLCNICPLPKEQIIDILCNKKQILINVYEEIRDNKNIDKEYWECGEPYKNNWHVVSDKPARDNGWYEAKLRRNSKFLRMAGKV